MEGGIRSTIVNLVLTLGYSFRLERVPQPRRTLHAGQTVVFVGRIKNDGLRIGTVYPIVRIASAYDHSTDVFNTDRDLSETARRALRTVDIAVAGTADFVVDWQLPDELKPTVYDARYELWSPPKLFRQRRPVMLDRKGWVGCFEVVHRSWNPRRRPRVFISYCWEPSHHREWVFALVDELARHDIELILDKYRLDIGDDVRATIADELRRCDAVLVVASDRYTARANFGIGGVGFETSILADPTYLSANRNRLIPVAKDNALPSDSKLPAYLAGSWYADMDQDPAHWKGERIGQIVSRVHAITECRNRDV